MSLKAYQDTQRILENPRETEYRLFGQVTHALIEARDTNASAGKLMEALDWNRKVWQAMGEDCKSDRNQLPQAVRAKIISLAIWVEKYTRRVIRKHLPLDPLIEVNRSIMQGLKG
jgi:flagellar biosynthesis activator protein FlaF